MRAKKFNLRLPSFVAIEGTNYRDAQSIDINTLEDIIYIGMKNDISFFIDDTLVLIQDLLCYTMAKRITPRKRF
ncbi:MAG: hypothetical protein FWG13_06125 [Leptospirales bacterium]|nr:hypothetical protein [Leptospirales bacterium]